MNSTTDRNTLLLNRAVHLIMGEWGYSEERAREWLNDDEMWNQWDYGGQWVGNHFVEDHTKIVAEYPLNCRTEPLPNVTQ